MLPIIPQALFPPVGISGIRSPLASLALRFLAALVQTDGSQTRLIAAKLHGARNAVAGAGAKSR